MAQKILLITIDALRADSVGCYNEASSFTPNIDRFASAGVKFTQAITCGGWTRPSFTGLLSSTYPSMYGGSWGKYHSSRPNLPELLQQNRIKTISINTNPQIGSLYGFDRGFDIFKELGPTYQAPSWVYKKGMQYLLGKSSFQQLIGLMGIKSAPSAVTATAEEATDKLLEVLQEYPDNFFAWIHFMDSHWPYHVSQELTGAKEIAQAWSDLRIMHQCSLQNGRYFIGEQALQEVMMAYNAAVSYIDLHVGRLIDGLDKLNLLTSTTIIITADHGEEFFEHGRWGHYQLFEENIRVPLIISTPEFRGGTTINTLVSLIDLAPTIMELMGLSKDIRMVGQSLIPVLNGGKSRPSIEPVYSESMWPDNYRLAIRNGKYKYLYELLLPDDKCLFDLSLDPGEERNIAYDDTDMYKLFDKYRRKHQSIVDITNEGIEVEDHKIDDQMRERLQALGYLE